MTTVIGIMLAIVAYLVGNLNFAYIITKKVKNEDIRDYGSGNAGTTNVLRTMGSKYALPVFLLDALKGTLCIFAARFLVANFDLSQYWIAVAGIAVVCGHNWPVFLGFRGGKGTATSIGVFLAWDPIVALIGVAVGLITLYLFKMVSLTSIVGMIALPITIVLLRCITYSPLSFSFNAELLLGLFLCCSTIFQHRTNIQRIKAGKESKIGQKVEMKK